MASLGDQMRGAGLEQPFAVLYHDSSAPGRTAAVWGGRKDELDLLGPQAALDVVFSAAGRTGGHAVGARVDVATGGLAGRAQCAPLTGTRTVVTMCAWTGDATMVAFLYGGVGPDTAAGQLPLMLPAIVTGG